MAQTLANDGSTNLNSTGSGIKLRANSSGVPMSHDDVDTNFENLRAKINEVIGEVGTNTTKLSGIETGANNYSLPLATHTVRGGIELFSNTDQSVAANSVSTTASRTYGIQLNSANQAVVNVPWTNTTYSSASSSNPGLSKLGSNTQQNTSANSVTSTASRTYAVQHNSADQLVVNVPWSNTNTTYSTATSGTAGLVKIGYSENGNNYPVELASGKMFVNVPSSGNAFNDMVEVSGGATDAQDQYRIGGANSMGSASQGQLSIVSSADALINLESSQTTEGGDASVIMKGATASIFMEEDVPTQTAGSTWNFGVSSAMLTSGVWKNAGPNDPVRYTQSATLLELKTIEATDGYDGNGGAYPELGSYPVFGVYKIGAALDLVNLDTSDVVDTMTSDGDKVIYMDQGSNLNFRSKFVGAGGGHRFYQYAVADTETDVPNNVALHLKSDKHTTIGDTIGYRNTGRTNNYTGVSSSNQYATSIEKIGDNISTYQTVLQTQKSTQRTTLDLLYEVADTTESNYGGGNETGISGSTVGFLSGIYLTSAVTGLNQQRSLRPGGYFDGAMNLGDAGWRWGTVYATTGSIDTSDRNSKQDIEDLSDAEKAVALTLKGLIKKYRFKDAVATKGDDARIHVGVIAQDVEQAFIDAGLDGFRYGILCKDTVYKVMVNGSSVAIQNHNNFVEEGQDGEPIEGATLEAEDRYAVRYNELLAFIISAL